MFQGINSLIKSCYDAGMSQTVYQSIVYFTFFVQFIFLFFYRKKCGISLKETILTVVIIYPFLYFWMLVVTWAELGFKNWGSNNIVRMYVWVPLVVFFFAKLLTLPSKTLDDFLAPSMALQQTVGHTVCPFAGCCNGYPCEWGIYNPVSEQCLFPNQWLECLVSLVILIVLLKYADHEGHKGSGKVFSMFMILFGSTRFLLEFLRDNEKVFFGISELAVHAALLALVGVYWLIDINEREKKKAKAAGIPKRAKAR